MTDGTNYDPMGINTVTSFLDASTIYNPENLQQLRENDRGRMKLTRYPTTPDGQFGLSTINITNLVFTDAFGTIFLREHNRLCEEFYATHGVGVMKNIFRKLEDEL